MSYRRAKYWSSDAVRSAPPPAIGYGVSAASMSAERFNDHTSPTRHRDRQPAQQSPGAGCARDLSSTRRPKAPTRSPVGYAVK